MLIRQNLTMLAGLGEPSAPATTDVESAIDGILSGLMPWDRITSAALGSARVAAKYRDARAEVSATIDVHNG